MQNRQQQSNPLNIIMGALTLVFILVGIYYIAKVMIWLLGALMPVFIIASLVIDHRVMLNYGKLLIKWTKKNPVVGLVAILFSILGMPLLAPFFFGKALLNRKVRKMRDETEGNGQRGRRDEYVTYEELPMDSSEPKDDVLLDLHDEKGPSPLDKSKRKSSYDELFEDLDIDGERPTKLW